MYNGKRWVLISLVFSATVCTISYVRQRERCSDFILRRIRSDKDVPRNLEAGIHVGKILEEHLGEHNLEIIQHNQPHSSEEASVMGSEIMNHGEHLHGLESAPSIVQESTITGLTDLAHEIVPSHYAKSDIIA